VLIPIIAQSLLWDDFYPVSHRLYPHNHDMYPIGPYLYPLVITLLVSCSSPTIDQRLESHVHHLASDDFMGREAGTTHEKEAAEYIRETFISIGLEPIGENDSYYQDFEFLAGKSPNDNIRLRINDEQLTYGVDFLPLCFSSKGAVRGNRQYLTVNADTKLSDLSLNRPKDEIANPIFFIELPDVRANPYIGYWQAKDLRNLSIQAKDAGAKAVVFFVGDSAIFDPKSALDHHVSSIDIPAIFLSKAEPDRSTTQLVQIEMDWTEDRRVGRNVLGMIDNGADHTIIVGGHHDGLGYSQASGMDELIIHNGADDGVSGLAVLIEMAREIKKKASEKYNYIFISFSGEEKGLLGSMYFSHFPTIDMKKVTCMLSMDHVGRMDSEITSFILYGVGTSPRWAELLAELNVEENEMITYDTGIGLTDHTPFYIKDIPVLSFATQVHEDFHQPTDVPENINYQGMVKIYEVMLQIDSLLLSEQKLPFSGTIDPAEALNFIEGLIEYAFEGRVTVDDPQLARPTD